MYPRIGGIGYLLGKPIITGSSELHDLIFKLLSWSSKKSRGGMGEGRQGTNSSQGQTPRSLRETVDCTKLLIYGVIGVWAVHLFSLHTQLCILSGRGFSGE